MERGRVPPYAQTVPDAAALVDLARYPLLDLDGAGAPMVARHAAELRATGVSILIAYCTNHASSSSTAAV